LPATELEALLIYQIGALAGIAQAEGGRLTHVKPHGALNNLACADAALANSVVAAIRSLDPSLILLAPALSELASGRRCGGVAGGRRDLCRPRLHRCLAAWSRAVTSRARFCTTADECVAHVLRMLEAGGIVSRRWTGHPEPSFHSICVHGDGPYAVAAAAADSRRVAGRRRQSGAAAGSAARRRVDSDVWPAIV
jgi:UPF0271 protein